LIYIINNGGCFADAKIYIDSRFKTNNSVSNSHFKYELNESVALPDKCVMFIDDIICPNAWLTVDEDNNKLYVRRFQAVGGNTDEIITISNNNYTSATLRTEIETKLNDTFGAAVFTVTYDANLLRYSITAADTCKIFTDKELIMGSPVWTGTALNTNNLNSINEILTNTIPAQAITIYTGIVDLRRYHNLYISSPNISSFTSMGARGESNIIKKIPVTSDYGSIIYDNVVANHDWIDVSKLLLKTIEFRISDAYGKTIDLRGMPVSFSLMFMLDQE
jgi:hypothetical protein